MNRKFIHNYINTYNNSLNKKAQIKHTLESLGKGNLKRKQRLEKNNQTIEDKTLPKEKRLKAIYENIYLSRIIKGDYKFAYLLLSITFIYRTTQNSLFRLIFNKKQINELVKPFDETLKFFEFTYLSPSKIANSCAICLYQYLKYCTDIKDEEKILKIIRDTILEHFPNHAHVNLRADNFKREIYCAGIYNGMPIFQWHTSSIKESYYIDKDIDKYYLYLKKALKDIGYIKYILIGLFIKDMKYNEDELQDKKQIRKVIKNLPLTYIKSYIKELEYQEQKNKPKLIKYYLFTPLRGIFCKNRFKPDTNVGVRPDAKTEFNRTVKRSSTGH